MRRLLPGRNRGLSSFVRVWTQQRLGAASFAALASVLLAAAPLAGAATAPEGLSSEARHARMIELQATRDALKPQSSPESRQAFAQAQAELDALSASLGGDLPCAVDPNGTTGASPPDVRVAPTAPPGCVPTTTTFTNSTAVVIPTGPAVVTSTIVVAGAGTSLWDLDLTTNITHTFAADLDITLMSPAGTVVTLTTDNGAGNDDVFNGTLWDDSANPAGQVPYVTNAGLVTDHPYVNLTTATPLVPEEAFAAFVGEDPNGTWTLTISDDLAGTDGGSLAAWSLALTTFPAAPVASPVQTFNQGTATAIPTGPAVVTSTLVVAGLTAPICNAVFRTDTLPHTFAADLDITLMSPTGTVVTLTTDNGAGNDNVFNGTQWTDDANPLGQVPYTTNAGLATDHPYVNLTTATPLEPEESMGAFMGELGNGTWTVTVSDDLAGDGGTFTWGLDFITCACPTTADLSVTKTDGVVTATPGGSVTYTITASNAGPIAVTGATVADTFAAPLTCTWTCVGAGGGTCTAAGSGNISDTVNLPVGASTTYTASCAVGASATGSLANTATVAPPAGITDPDPSNNSATDTDTLTPSADLAITKTDGVTTATPGGSVTYTIVASNAGPSDAPGATVADTFPAALTCTWTCVGAGGGTCTAAGSGNIGDTVNLPAGGSVTYTATCAVSGAATGTLTNTATVTAPAGVTDPAPGNNSATDVDTITASADLATSVTDAPDPVSPGANLVYNASVANNGPSPADAVSLSFPLAANTTFVSAVASAGGTCTTPPVGAAGTVTCNWAGATAVGTPRTLTLTVQVSPTASGTLTTTATASTTTADPNAANNAAAVSTAVGSASADLSITLTDTPDPVSPGTNLTYTGTVTNNGPSDAQAVQLAMATPANTTFVSAAPGAGGTCTTPAVGGTGTVTCTWAGATAAGANRSVMLVVQVNPSATGMITGSATASATSADPNAANNTATATTAVSASADLSLTLAAAPNPVSLGAIVTLTATASNAGPSDAQGVQITLTLPATLGFVSVNPGAGGVCTSPAAGASGNVVCTYAGATAVGATRTVVVTATALAQGSANVTATVTSTTPDPTPANGQASVGVQIGGPAVIPALGRVELLFLGLLLGLMGAAVLRRRGRFAA